MSSLLLLNGSPRGPRSNSMRMLDQVAAGWQGAGGEEPTVLHLQKRAADQMIPLVHPYLVIENGEMHHRPRYERYPLMGLLLSPDADTDAEDLEITEHLWSRMARNMKSSLVFTTIATVPAKEAADELAAVA
jgi:hypothetical protein